MKENHWNNGEKRGQKNNTAVSISGESNVVESKRRTETSVGIRVGFDGKHQDLKLGNRQRHQRIQTAKIALAINSNGR